MSDCKVPRTTHIKKEIKRFEQVSTYIPIKWQRHGMMRATSYFHHFLYQQICANLNRSNALISCAIPELAVTIMSPSIYFTICKNIEVCDKMTKNSKEIKIEF